jgi:hypothetical protein
MTLEIDWDVAWDDLYEFHFLEDAHMILVYNEKGPGYFDGLAAKIPMSFASQDQIDACGKTFERPRAEPPPKVPVFLEGGPFDDAVLPSQVDCLSITMYIGSKGWIYAPKDEQQPGMEVWECKGEVNDS